MDEEEKKIWIERSKVLRAELKVWEKEFQSQNEGRKASREDIKKNPEIASKYKEYDKVRNILSGKVAPAQPTAPKSTPRKRKHDELHKATPQKRLQVDKTPSKGSMQPWDVDPYYSPSIMRNLFATPQKKTAIGPTPQKDGQVLGLFDLEEDSPADTPSMAAGTGKAAPTQATPRKQKSPDESRALHSRTPSSRKQSTLNPFTTPSKNRILDTTQGTQTPSSISKLHFSTPSFLRRDSQRIQMPSIDETSEGGPPSPEMIRVPRKPIIRGLSSMLAGLRKMEDDAADEDLEALREMEMEMENGPKPKPKPPSKPSDTSPPSPPPPSEILVKDSQPNFPLGAFDDEAQYDTEPEEQQNPTQPIRKPYKKKGQKRTTRRVNLRPTRSKPVPAPTTTPLHEASSSEDELSHSVPDLIPEIQLIPETQLPEEEEEGRNYASDSASSYTASEGGTRYRRPDQEKNRSLNKEGKVKSAARKVKASAHQNFKRLKLRNSGMKGGPGVGSRFRRRK
ncbi:hypothetical protein CJF32_00001180 [Rutstroemia sp. NJR-2017a WRK4]|nr:hypothetical protein CJF32_00001180 [Rutstroemia sp. NJR-2017a WRK4]